MSDLSLTNTLVAGTPEDVNDVQQNFTDVVTWANGNIDSDNFTATTNQNLGLSETGTVRRGKAIIATEEGRTNTAYGTLTTPDQVANVVLPTDGLIVVAYQAMWKESVDGAARAAIFIGSNQISVSVQNATAPGATEAQVAATANTYISLNTCPLGLYGEAGVGATAYTADVTTGQVIGVVDVTDSFNRPTFNSGGPCYIFAAAGTYTVSVQYKASSGTVTAKNRKLWVWTHGFG